MSSEVIRGTAEMVLAELYVSDREGNDATGDGTKEKPFKTGLKALMTVGKEPFPTIYVDSQKENEIFVLSL
uniref:Asparaginyl-tRNA synthetase 1 n=1 Tax=Mus musculus TaxID=10090 RepID=A0A494B949_MOUSE